jgi:AcrR family transcriptional regulator
VDFQRARRPEQVQARREAILEAARRLALAQGVAAVSLGAIAAEVGLAKSNVLRYVETREDLYLQLAAEDWRAWEASLALRLGGPKVGVVEAAAALAASLAERPLLCQLLGQPLEQNVSLSASRRYRLGVLRVVGELGALLSRSVSGLTPEDGAEVVALATALAGATWPLAHPPAHLAALFTEEPALAASRVAFEPRLRQLLVTALTGVRTLRLLVTQKGKVPAR